MIAVAEYVELAELIFEPEFIQNSLSTSEIHPVSVAIDEAHRDDKFRLSKSVLKL